jgi:hypothetical protein
MLLHPAYTAGLFDGEGCVTLIYTVRRRRVASTIPILGFKFVVLVSNTHRQTLDRLRRMYGGYVHQSAHKLPNHKIGWAWRLTTFREQQHFLTTIAPYSYTKKRAVQLGLRYLSTAKLPGRRTPTAHWKLRIRIYRELSIVNRRGKPRRKRATPIRPPDGWKPTRRFTTRELANIMRRVRASKEIRT